MYAPIITVSETRQAELDAMPYLEYLQSWEWYRIKKAKLAEQPHCQLCGSTSELQIHHNHYPEHRGTEALSDLTVLCDPCHESFHYRINTTDPRIQGANLILEYEKNLEQVWVIEEYRTNLLNEVRSEKYRGISATL